jgi:ABC-type multidrug transport system fused ATPase/permease subunit
VISLGSSDVLARPQQIKHIKNLGYCCKLQIIASLVILIVAEWKVALFLIITIPLIFWYNEQGIEEVASSNSLLNDLKKFMSHQVEEIVIQINTIKILNLNDFVSCYLLVRSITC